MSLHTASLSGGRLHLSHGPIDLVIGCDGDARAAYDAATRRFSTVLDELMGEISLLRQADGPCPRGDIARQMWRATQGHGVFVTPMAGVAGAVAEAVLAAMCDAADLRRAYVNNGGDIALFLAPGETFRMAMQGVQGADYGRITIGAADPVRGLATSGRGGRSLSMGIADSVTVLAGTAARADVAATLIANAVDVPGHPGILRRPANEMQPDSDLGTRLVVESCTELNESDISGALVRGAALAEAMRARGAIVAAALFLGHGVRTVGADHLLNIREGADA